jgi:antirestriction protein ArdC
MESFYSCASYYHTLFHEMTHATGHASRLARPGIVKFDTFGSDQYSQEELVAELGGAFLSNESGILSDVQFENSAAYLANWQAALSKDRKLIVSAASQAQKASDYVLQNKPSKAEDTLSE